MHKFFELVLFAQPQHTLGTMKHNNPNSQLINQILIYWRKKPFWHRRRRGK